MVMHGMGQNRCAPPYAVISWELAPSPARIPNTFRAYTLVLIFIGLRAVGNLSLAWGTKHFPQTLSVHPMAYLVSMLDPFVAVGVAMLLLSLFSRMALLSVADLSFVLPTTAIGYVVATVLGRFFLHEQVTPERWLATLLIFAGAALVGSTSHTTTPPSERPR